MQQQPAAPAAEQHYAEQQAPDHAADVRNMVASIDKRTLYRRILAVMGACTYVRKDTKVSGFGGGYSAVSHDAVMAKIRPYLVEHGIVPIFTTNSVSYDRFQVMGKSGPRDVNRASAHVTLTLINADNPADRLSIDGFGQGDDAGDKACGKAVSYACKYAILKAFMLETGDDTDHDASVEQIRINEQAEAQATAQAKNLIALLEQKNPQRAGEYRNQLTAGEHSAKQIIAWISGELKKYDESEGSE